MRRALAVATVLALTGGMLVLAASPAAAKPAACPNAYELADLAELQAFVANAGGDPSDPELLGFFEFVDMNVDGFICFKTLPEATPFKSPPLLAGDNKVRPK